MQELGKQIKALRQQRELTQEAVANALGVSIQAVSKWENGHSMPDISLLIPLSSLLGTSVDTLLGGNKRQQYEKKFQKALTMYGSASNLATLALTEEALKECPNDDTLLYRRACDEFFIGKAETGQTRDHYLSLSRIHFRELIHLSPEFESAKSMLAGVLLESGLKEEALEMAYQIKKDSTARNALLSKILEGGDREKHFQKLIQTKVSELSNALHRYGTKESMNVLESLLRSYYENDEEHPFLRFELIYIHSTLAALALKEDDHEAFLSHLETAYHYSKPTGPTAVPAFLSAIVKSPPKGQDTYIAAFLSQNKELLARPEANPLKRRIIEERFRVSALDASHFALYLHFYNQHAFYSEGEAMPSNGVDADPRKDPIASLERVRESIENGHIKGYFGYFGDALMAFCRIKPKKDDASPSTAVIDHLIIPPEFRFLGMEERLLRTASEELEKEGYTRIEAHLKEGEVELIAAYKRAGFVPLPKEADTEELPLRRECPQSGSSLILRLGEFLLDIDVEATRAFYEKPNRYHCQCDGCRNYRKAAHLTSASVQEFLTSLGLDPEDPDEVYGALGLDGPEEDGTYLYNGWYHLVGVILEAPPHPTTNEELDRQTYTPDPDYPFGVWFHDNRQSMCLSDCLPKPVIEMTISHRLPWVL